MNTVLRFFGYISLAILWNALLLYSIQFISIPIVNTSTFLGCILYLVILMLGILFVISSVFLPLFLSLWIELKVRNVL